MRGYGLTALVDGASGVALAFDLRDATRAHEPRVLRQVLLPRTFEFSPEVSVRAIVGDAKYDDDPTHEYLETHFGVHLVAARHAHALRARQGLQRDDSSVDSEFAGRWRRDLPRTRPKDAVCRARCTWQTRPTTRTAD
jgi:hypothetical protein